MKKSLLVCCIFFLSACGAPTSNEIEYPSAQFHASLPVSSGFDLYMMPEEKDAVPAPWTVKEVSLGDNKENLTTFIEFTNGTRVSCTHAGVFSQGSDAYSHLSCTLEFNGEKAEREFTQGEAAVEMSFDEGQSVWLHFHGQTVDVLFRRY